MCIKTGSFLNSLLLKLKYRKEKQDKWLSNYGFLIAGPPKSEMTEEEVEKCKELLTRAKEYLEKLSDDVIEKDLENNLESFLKKLDTDIYEYEKALEISERGKIVILKRTLKERYMSTITTQNG